MILNNFQTQDEILIVDDGSTDDTSRILGTLEGKVKDLRVLRTKSRGLVEALNLGFAEADSNWVARYDVDDIYSDTRIVEQQRCMNSQVSVIFADYSMQLSNGLGMGFFPSPLSNIGTKLSLLRSQQTAHSVALINRNHFYEAGGYRKKYFPAEDLDLWLRMSRIGNFVSVPIELLTYGLSNTSTSGSRQRQAKEMKTMLINKVGVQLPAEADLEFELSLTLKSYENTSHFALRTFLLLQNIKFGSELGLISPRLSQLFWKKNFPRILNQTSDLANALGYKIARNLYRKFG